MAFFTSPLSGFFGSLFRQHKGVQTTTPPLSIGNSSGVGTATASDALTVSTVWACLELRANMVAGLPLFTYDTTKDRQVDSESGLAQVLKHSPNSRQTAFEFWRGMILSHDLFGNAYARIERNSSGEVIALWQMPSEQVTVEVLERGVVYKYTLDGNVAVFAEQNVLHIRNLGNTMMGFDKLSFMGGTVGNAININAASSGTFKSGGRASGILMVDKLLSPEQRARLQENFKTLTEGNTASLNVLEADMKYSQLSLAPQMLQMNEAKTSSVNDVCRWFGVPPIMLGSADGSVSVWGSGVEQIVLGFYKTTLRPLLLSIEQSLTKRVLTPNQRQTRAVEFEITALLRGSPTERYETYTKAINNGILTPNEVRRLENFPSIEGGDKLLIQGAMIPIMDAGKQFNEGAENADNKKPIA